MKAQSVSGKEYFSKVIYWFIVKKRVNYGNIKADDPKFSEKLMKMEAKNVKKQIVNNSIKQEKMNKSRQQSTSPNTSFSQSLSAATAQTIISP